MEASALHRRPSQPLSFGRITMAGPLLKLRSDEQLVLAFRAGSEEAFAVIHERYKQLIFVYCRQMLNGPRQDAEDVLQDVFVRAYGALRNDDRQVNLRAWLYRVAHNRCIDQLRRPQPAEREIFEMSRTPLHDPIIEAQRREDLKKLVEDVSALPEQQRSALLMRELDGMSYNDLADALGTTVPAVKSLLVRARVGLAEAAEARDMDCSVIRTDLAEAFDRGVRASGRARKHLKECAGCRDYKLALRTTRKQFAALAPTVGFAPIAALLGKIGLGGGAAGGATAAGGSGLVALGTVSATKVAIVVAGVAVATGGAVEVKHVVAPAPKAAPHVAKQTPAKTTAATSAANLHQAVATAPSDPIVQDPTEQHPTAGATTTSDASTKDDSSSSSDSSHADQGKTLPTGEATEDHGSSSSSDSSSSSSDDQGSSLPTGSSTDSSSGSSGSSSSGSTGSSSTGSSTGVRGGNASGGSSSTGSSSTGSSSGSSGSSSSGSTGSSSSGSGSTGTTASSGSGSTGVRGGGSTTPSTGSTTPPGQAPPGATAPPTTP